MIKKDVLSPEQETAAEPTQNVWVQANAGTGKTSVLTARLLRILFRTPDKNSGILCLTYTNAAAGEMRNRILAALREWAMSNDADLRELLHGIALHDIPSDADLARARQIFFTYIDNPEILKIKTIHGFCEEILHRFPTEAGISPSWTLISDAPQRILLREALDRIVNSCNTDDRLARAFEHLVGTVSEYKLDDLLEYVDAQYKHFFKIRNIDKYREYFIETVRKKLNLGEAISEEVPRERLRQILLFAKNEKKIGKTLQRLIDLTEQYIENAIDFDEYKKAYLTSEGTVIKNGLNYEYLGTEKDRVLRINIRHINNKIFDDTVALFDFSAAFAAMYNNLKKSYNVLDFEDLILYTHRLFSNPESMGWVLSQMDLSLSHILVDEAQDTGPLQWEILQMLSGDFFTDGENTDLPRSLFVVGDTKQSIYGFQGADPHAFATSRQEIAATIKNNVRQIREVPLTQSFRSTEPILKTVDMFFGDAYVANKTGFINNEHKCFRIHDHGLVELHHLDTSSTEETSTARKKYIRKIGDKIESLIRNNSCSAKDIMILVQQRAPMAVLMANELKRRGIPVAGSDRIILPDYPVIKDLMNLLRFCMNNSDDYSLCCVLKSPMFAMNEDAIYEICTARNAESQRKSATEQSPESVTVFKILEKMHPNIHKILVDFVRVYADAGPYSFFSYVLNNYDNREKMVAALGTQIIDPLEEFMTICLAYERTRPGTLHHFIKWFITGNSEVKRDMDAENGVRIVTVHGSKGLQSRIVFLVDTTGTPRLDNFYGVPTTAHTDMPVWVWTSHKPSEYSPEFQELYEIKMQNSIEESFRLLYVAMTRARDELYIYGFTPYTSAPELSWHSMLWGVLSAKVANDGNVIRISNHDK